MYIKILSIMLKSCINATTANSCPISFLQLQSRMTSFASDIVFKVLYYYL